MKRIGKDEIYRAVTAIITATEGDLSRLYMKALERVVGHTPKLLRSRLVKGEFVELQKHPAFREALRKEIEALTIEVNKRIAKGIDDAYLLSNEHCDEELYSYLGKDAKRVPQEIMERYLGANLPAESMFKRKGLGLVSDRVWKDSERTIKHLELSIGDALSEGMSAEKLSRVIRQDLLEPNNLFRRVRNKHGELVLSRTAKTFHPGQGVYRSSYKNAMRLARTEINSAYRTADHERWKDMDFVLGIRISLSNNHTLNGRPFYDICDELAGVYPKEFKFTGWHPQCRCLATTILEDNDSFYKRLLGGGDAPKGVKDMPMVFRKWEIENATRIIRSQARGTLPYFLRDNQRLMSQQLQL